MARKAVSGQASLIRDIKRQKTLVKTGGGGGSGSGTLHDAFSLDATVGSAFDLSGQALAIDAGAADGDIIVVVGGNLTYLNKGNDDQVLSMNGSTLEWGGGWGTGITDVSLAASAEGSNVTWARTDHVHTLDQSITPLWTGAHTFFTTSKLQFRDAGLYINAPSDGNLTLNSDGVLSLDASTRITSSAPVFRFDAAGELGTLSGDLRVYANADVNLDPLGNNVVFSNWGASKSFESSNFASQSTGWAIAYGSNGGDADFRYIFADEMWVKAFTMDTTMALAGSIILTKSRAKVSRDLVIPISGAIVGADTIMDFVSIDGNLTSKITAGDTFVVSGSTGNDGTWTVASTVYDAGNVETDIYVTGDITDATADGVLGFQTTLYVEDHEGIADTAVFVADDYVLLRVIDHSGGGLVVANVYGQVTAYSDDTGGEQHWTFTTTTHDYSGAHTIHLGTVALDFGQTGSGSTGVWSATVLDAAGSPYSQVQTWDTITNGEPANFVTYVRVGNLDGIAGVDLEYGLWAGNGAVADDDVYLIMTGDSAELHNIPLEIHDGSNAKIKLDAAGPYMSVGPVAPTSYNGATGFWVGNDSGTYKMSLGDPTASHMLWDGDALEIHGDSGALVIDLPGSGNAQIVGTLEVVSPGEITAGGGDVRIDENGIYLAPTQSGFATVNAVHWGTLAQIYYSTSINHFLLTINQGTDASPTAELQIGTTQSAGTSWDGVSFITVGTSTYPTFYFGGAPVVANNGLLIGGAGGAKQVGPVVDLVIKSAIPRIRLWDSGAGTDDAMQCYHEFGYAGTWNRAAYMGFYSAANDDFLITIEDGGNFEINAAYISFDAASAVRSYAGNSTHSWYNSGNNERMRLSDGKLNIGADVATSDGKMSYGIKINQSTTDNHVLAFDSDDVIHGMTDYSAANIYAFMQKSEATSGGLQITGLKDSHGVGGYALELQGLLDENANTNKGSTSSTSVGVVDVLAAIRSGSGITYVNADGNLMTIRDYALVRFIFDKEGSGHSEVNWVSFDEHDDVALLDAVETHALANGDPIKEEFGAFMTYNKAQIQELGLAQFEDDRPGRAMVNWTKMSMLHTGAIRQLGAQAVTHETRLGCLERKVDVYERALLGLGVDVTALVA